MSDFPHAGGLRGHGHEFAEAMQRIRDEEKRELAEDRVIDLLRLSRLVDRVGESHTLHRVKQDLIV
jgi:hypothetical protein